MISPRRWLYLTHRWLGIAVCLLMAMWFVSGVVMMYVGYPKLTPAERLARLPPLALPDGCCVAPAKALAAAARGEGNEAKPERGGRGRGGADPRLAMLVDRPVWLVASGGRGAAVVDAVTGERLGPFGGDHALRAAAAFLPGGTPRLVETTRQDIFTVSRALDPHRPLHRVALGDAAGTEVWVSSSTGEVVRDATAMERGWNWLGSILHWFYPLKGEWFDGWRSDAIIYTSLAGTILAALGLWVGMLRWRFRGRFKSGSKSPYRDGWMKWHHVAGLAFGAVTLTWVFSGLMSMNPWKVFDAPGPRPDPAVLAGVRLDKATFAVTPADAIERSGIKAKEVTVRLFDGRAWYAVAGADGATRLVDASDPAVPPRDRVDEARLGALAAGLVPGHRLVSLERLQAYDDYWYGRRPHTMTGHVERALPVWRAKYDDPNATWVHLDPRTGAIASRIDSRGRVKRWLFAFLHSFDAWGWPEARPAWDAALILLSLGGLVVSAGGVVIGWRRLKRKAGAPPVGASPSERTAEGAMAGG
jgi:uncharacterized iron-regulated membrane protein